MNKNLQKYYLKKIDELRSKLKLSQIQKEIFEDNVKQDLKEIKNEPLMDKVLVDKMILSLKNFYERR